MQISHDFQNAMMQDVRNRNCAPRPKIKWALNIFDHIYAAEERKESTFMAQS
jgi:hypothetical protein